MSVHVFVYIDRSYIATDGGIHVKGVVKTRNWNDVHLELELDNLFNGDGHRTGLVIVAQEAVRDFAQLLIRKVRRFDGHATLSELSRLVHRVSRAGPVLRAKS